MDTGFVFTIGGKVIVWNVEVHPYVCTEDEKESAKNVWVLESVNTKGKDTTVPFVWECRVH